jgi:hypothetical protein
MTRGKLDPYISCPFVTQLSYHNTSVLMRRRAENDLNTQGDSKRWTQLKSKRCLNTRQTVGYGIHSSLLALRVYLRGLPSKVS